jgi:hypothetical protein
MGHSIDSNGKKSRVAENNLVIALGRRISLYGSPNVSGQNSPQLWQGLYELEGRFIPTPYTLGTRLPLSQTVMLKRQDNLSRKIFKKLRRLLAQAVFQINRVRNGLGKIARKEDSSGLMNYMNNRFVRRERNSSHVVERIAGFT